MKKSLGRVTKSTRSVFTVCVSLGLLVLLLPSPCWAQYKLDPAGTPICTESADQADAVAVADGSGGFYVAWEDMRDGTSRIYVQRLDEWGRPLWDTDGKEVCLEMSEQVSHSIAADLDGGLYVVWEDHRAPDFSVYAQRFDSLGAYLWDSYGLEVTASTSSQSAPQAIADGAGGLIVCWTEMGFDPDIEAQRLDDAGTQLWGSAGEIICDEMGPQESPQLVSDDSTGAVIAWEDWRAGETDIYAQRVADDGTTLWTHNGAPICTELGGQTLGGIVSDGQRGAILAWTDERHGSYTRVYSQRVSNTGGLVWSSAGVPVTSSCSADQREASPVPDGIGGAVVGWVDTHNDLDGDVLCQRIDAGGSYVWASAGVEICIESGLQRELTSMFDGSRTWFAWEDERDSGQTRVYVETVDDNGDFQWKEGGVRVAEAKTEQNKPRLVATAEGGCLVTWGDRLGGGMEDIYGQVFPWGWNVLVHYNSIPTQSDETTLGAYIGPSKIQYRCKHVPVICAGTVSAGNISGIKGLANVSAVSYARTYGTCLDVSVKAIKVRSSTTYPYTVWDDLGYKGENINVAIIDTGVDDSSSVGNGHHSLNDFDDNDGTSDPKFVAGTNCVTNTDGNPDDNAAGVFHGTHCAGIAVGTGGSGATSTYRGVAPGAGLVDVKVFSAFPVASTADVMQGMEWCIDNKDEHNIRVANMSLGSAQDSDGSTTTDSDGNTVTDEECALANKMVDAGIVVIVAAGNEESDERKDHPGLGPPGSADKVITVASMIDSSTVDRTDDVIAPYSNHGPRKSDGDGDTEDEKKPEITAPGGGTGHKIWSAQGNLGDPDDNYVEMMGTSMAAPHIAGVAALMLDANPGLKPSQVENILISTAEDWGIAGWDTTYGYGYVDAYAAVLQAESQADGGMCVWNADAAPHRDDGFWMNPHWIYDPGTAEHTMVLSNYNALGSASGYTATFSYMEPTCCNMVGGAYAVPFATDPVPVIAPGDSVTMGPYASPHPVYNSFGEPYWSYCANVESSDDETMSQWPTEDNNSAFRSYWVEPCAPGDTVSMHFWMHNGEDREIECALEVDDSDIPSGWTWYVTPPPGAYITLSPGGSYDGELWMIAATPDTAGTLHVKQTDYDSDYEPIREAGGLSFRAETYETVSTGGGRERYIFALRTPVPNPSTGSCALSFSLERRCKMTLRIMNVRGALVRTLVDGARGPGWQTEMWDGRDDSGRKVSSGVYIARMEAPGYRKTHKLVLAR